MKAAVLRTVLATMMCTMAVPPAFAQSSYVDIEQRLTPEQLRTVGLTPVQLDLLNRMLREAQEKEAVEPTNEGHATPPAAVAVSAREPRGEDSLVGFNDEPIHSRLKGSVSQWQPGTVFELENGQQWKVLKGHMKLPQTLDTPQVVVVPGVAGRWFLQVHEDAPKARVYRID